MAVSLYLFNNVFDDKIHKLENYNCCFVLHKLRIRTKTEIKYSKNVVGIMTSFFRDGDRI